uniref:Uncharacterized protein n=1 Tax=Pseudomonas phage RVTF4 TaxID=3236931 RepID=A0AB39CCY1_9VIRU
MRVFAVIFLLCVTVVLGACIWRDRKYPRLKKGWDKCWQHRLALGGLFGMIVCFLMMLILWLI